MYVPLTSELCACDSHHCGVIGVFLYVGTSLSLCVRAASGFRVIKYRPWRSCRRLIIAALGQLDAAHHEFASKLTSLGLTDGVRASLSTVDRLA